MVTDARNALFGHARITDMFKNFFKSGLISSYKKRESVMDKREVEFFFELQKQIPNGFYIFPKMRVADIIETTDGKGYYAERNNILPKHTDFLIADKNFRPILAIELNGSSHTKRNRKESDNKKREVFQLVGLPLEFVEVGTDFSTDVRNLITRYFAS